MRYAYKSVTLWYVHVGVPRQDKNIGIVLIYSEAWHAPDKANVVFNEYKQIYIYIHEYVLWNTMAPSSCTFDTTSAGDLDGTISHEIDLIVTEKTIW